MGMGRSLWFWEIYAKPSQLEKANSKRGIIGTLSKPLLSWTHFVYQIKPNLVY